VGLALSSWWTVGWAAGAVIVLAVAVLLLTITALARRIDHEAREVVVGLGSITLKTDAIRDVGRTGIAVRTITSCLRRVRTGSW
jgi:hypothetical protein